MSEEKPSDQAPAAVVDFGREKREKNLLRGPVGNKHAEKHGFYSEGWTDEERAERAAFQQSITADKGDPTSGERALITTAGGLNTIINRAFRAIEQGRGAPAPEHLLAMINSFRLIMCALGLQRREKPGPTLAEYLEQKAKAAERTQ